MNTSTFCNQTDTDTIQYEVFNATLCLGSAHCSHPSPPHRAIHAAPPAIPAITVDDCWPKMTITFILCRKPAGQSYTRLRDQDIDADSSGPCRMTIGTVLEYIESQSYASSISKILL